MNSVDKQYFELLKHLLKNGVKKMDRTGTGTIGVFGHQMRFNLQDGFPLITTKKMFTKGIIYELLGDETGKQVGYFKNSKPIFK